MGKQVLAVRVEQVGNQASMQFRNGSSGSFTVSLKTEFLPGKYFWSSIPKTFITEEAATKQAVKLAKKFNCEVQK